MKFALLVLSVALVAVSPISAKKDKVLKTPEISAEVSDASKKMKKDKKVEKVAAEAKEETKKVEAKAKEETKKVETKVSEVEKEVKATVEKAETKAKEEVEKVTKPQPKKAEVKAEKKEEPAKVQQKTVAKKKAVAGGIHLSRLEICTSIENRVPKGSADSFGSDVGTLYCFSHVNGAKDTVAIKHVWYKDDAPVGGKELTVKSASWRTWSLKSIDGSMAGNWRVDVIDKRDGSVIDSKSFTVR